MFLAIFPGVKVPSMLALYESLTFAGLGPYKQNLHLKMRSIKTYLMHKCLLFVFSDIFTSNPRKADYTVYRNPCMKPSMVERWNWPMVMSQCQHPAMSEIGWQFGCATLAKTQKPSHSTPFQ